MNITIFGLGYVGLVTSLCLADLGHQVTGVEISEAKIQKLKTGQLPIVEPGLDRLFENATANQSFTYTSYVAEALVNVELALIAVPTPSLSNGTLNLNYVRDVVLRDILPNLGERAQPLTLVIRSTILPGTCSTLQNLADRIRPGAVRIAHVPEFLREGSAVSDFFNPPYNVIGSDFEDEQAFIASVMEIASAPTFKVQCKVAEMIKYVSNAFHATKIAFVNEIGRLCNALQIDSTEIMSIACEDRKLNISAAYMRPGFAYGGSCLPKDLRALVGEGRYLGQRLNLLESLSSSNTEHIAHTHRIILNALGDSRDKSILVCGITFKPHTDDLRESPTLELIQRLMRTPYQLRIYDELITPANLVGANLEYQRLHLSNLGDMLYKDLDAALEQVDLIVYNHGSAELDQRVTDSEARWTVVDLNGRLKDRIPAERYHTII